MYFLEFENLLPERNYQLCVYFENQHRVVANSGNSTCVSFSMQTWGQIIKTSIKFSGTIFESQLNNLLCYFSKASNSYITQVVDIEGKSCSLNTSANNYNFAYNGSVVTN